MGLVLQYIPYVIRYSGVLSPYTGNLCISEGAAVSKKKINLAELSPEEREEELKRRRARARRKRVGRVIDRIFGFFLVTGIVFGLAGLALEYVLVKGPSPSLRDQFTMTMLETRRFRFIPNVFLTTDEVAEIRSRTRQHTDQQIDTSLIQIPQEQTEVDDGKPKPDAYGLIDEDGDGIVLENIKGNGYVGYMITVLDPKRVFVGMPESYGGYGLTVGELCERYGALGGINGGAFFDKDGGGTGGIPDGLTIIDGVYWNEGYGGDSFVGFDDQGIMHVGYFSPSDAAARNIVNGVSFGPILVMNGYMDPASLASGVNPRTAIGQRADGAVLLLVIDGRQVHSIGATYQDVAEVMIDHGAVNACNLDGGSSTVMYYNGDYVNSCSSANGIARPVPNAFLFK